MSAPHDDSGKQSAFAREAEEQPTSWFGEYFYFLKTTRKWWLLPILLIILAFGAILVVAGSPLAPFIYALF
jgi:hypothetical protein